MCGYRSTENPEPGVREPVAQPRRTTPVFSVSFTPKASVTGRAARRRPRPQVSLTSQDRGLRRVLRWGTLPEGGQPATLE
ncbi:hypothetical protein C3K23_10815 [Streptomyces sp. 604F]|nr:hypothetical protein C3K23_10815 [Streptomyces sp. 604F]